MSNTVRVLSQEEYTRLIQDQYVETYSRDCSHKGSRGKYVILKKPISCCERIWRMTACIFVAPFACLGSMLTCGREECCYAPCCGGLCSPSIDGAFIEEGYLQDKEKTLKYKNKDFQQLGFEDGMNHKNIITLAESGRFITHKSKKYPQHSFQYFYGPFSNFSYIILIPENQINDVRLQTAYLRDEGTPLTT